MNVILNPLQSDTKTGDITLAASVNLTGPESYLWKIINNNGQPNFALPTAASDFAYFVGASGDVAGNNVAAESPDVGENCRIAFSGTCNPGDALSLNPNAWGQLYKPQAGAGAIFYDWIAEEAGNGGTPAVPQYIKVRRVASRAVTL
ncbi:MAG: hypothetical protein ABSE48_02665 [Verrucomicrobiota bacterium]|jgi:hypothetical protein